ncbi:GNAT family N-acetyltransferase [Adhaeribacter rhizoryzae]|uniref:GNAT family N-acetyltransferase n=1 Tax=Adhaeribacter rhizoryzae TaxID=2607907 RepID=A0A5M6DHK5_9BACT|nr:GNAT family N-acetyltransferase [Adhaeribacter rhizoryzae]KAA5545752.1 GNAT family N-acetyltransferase [Adhaeribacter rhizoryzae]
MATTSAAAKPEILPYAPAYKEAFRRLNHEWINKYFELEDLDNQILDNPENYIIAKGGHILFARYQGEIVGTCALLKVTDTTYELGKMAVTEKVQGLKIGQSLCQAAIAEAKALGATTLELYSHRSLQSALHVYHKLGFRQVPCPPSAYKRSDIKMELDLTAS